MTRHAFRRTRDGTLMLTGAEHASAIQTEPRFMSGVHSEDNRCDSVVWFGNVDWWYCNRGHASTRMASRIAGYLPTIWM